MQGNLEVDFPALQNGSYVPGRQIQSTQNVSEYSVFPFADLEGYDDMTPTLGTCFANTTGLSINNTLFGLVDACTQKNEECCYDAANVGDQVSSICSKSYINAYTGLQTTPLTCTAVSMLLHPFNVTEYGWWVL